MDQQIEALEREVYPQGYAYAVAQAQTDGYPETERQASKTTSDSGTIKTITEKEIRSGSRINNELLRRKPTGTVIVVGACGQFVKFHYIKQDTVEDTLAMRQSALQEAIIQRQFENGQKMDKLVEDTSLVNHFVARETTYAMAQIKLESRIAQHHEAIDTVIHLTKDRMANIRARVRQSSALRKEAMASLPDGYRAVFESRRCPLLAHQRDLKEQLQHLHKPVNHKTVGKHTTKN